MRRVRYPLDSPMVVLVDDLVEDLVPNVGGVDVQSATSAPSSSAVTGSMRAPASTSSAVAGSQSSPLSSSRFLIAPAVCIEGVCQAAKELERDVSRDTTRRGHWGCRFRRCERERMGVYLVRGVDG